jgi:hypothetical protein
MTRSRFPVGAGHFFSTAPGPDRSGAQPGVPAALLSGVKRPTREADHSPPFSAEVKNAWSYISSPPYVFMALFLVKHTGNCNFIFLRSNVSFFDDP